MKHRVFQPNDEPKLPISAFVIAKNEESNIRECLASLSFCAEIIVVDSGSIDRTRQIAAEMGAVVYSHEFQGYKEQKQWALNQCSQPWALSLDADERVTEEFYEFLKTFDFDNAVCNGYELKRLHWFLGEWIWHSGLYPDYKLRFFRREKGRLVGANIHEVIEVEGETEKLPYDLLHYSWPGIREYFSTQLNYAAKVAQNKYQMAQSASVIDLIARPLYTFFHRYFFRAGFLDGIPGLVIALGAALGTAYKYLHLWELARRHSNRNTFFAQAKPFRLFLKPLQFIYLTILKVRLWAYQKGWLKKSKLSAPVISVGNLTVGGAGKTPFTLWLAKALTKQGLSKITVLSRGYHSKIKANEVKLVAEDALPDEVGDEPLLMSRVLAPLGVKVVIGPQRAKAGTWALENLGSELFLLDDGFQHIALERNRNICLLDCSDVYAKDLLPVGSAREPFGQLKRADAIVLTRAKHNPVLKEKYLSSIEKHFSEKPLFELEEGLSKFTLGLTPLEEYPQGKKVLAFSGLGNPRQFFESLEAEGLILQKTVVFPDHYKYRQADIQRLQEELMSAEAQFMVTTLKDAVKIAQIEDLPKLLVAHSEIRGLRNLSCKDCPQMIEEASIQLRNLLGSEMFENLFPAHAEKIG